MNNYKNVLILHAFDSSTSFLDVFRKEFGDLYVSFDSDKESINKAKSLLGDLESKSLIIYLGHGSSSGLYEPDDSHTYAKYFLNTTWGNHFFDEHDIFLLSCNSNEYARKIYKCNSSIGFGNIISSRFELDLHNEKKSVKLSLDENDIMMFNNIYINSSFVVIKRLLNDEIYFSDVPKYLRFMVNKEINNFLLNKSDAKRLQMTKLLYEFRNDFMYNKNPQSV